MKFSPVHPFDLPPLPPGIDFRSERFFDHVASTRTELGELSGYSRGVPNPMLLLSPAVIRESVASSSIENINTTVRQVLQMQLFPEAEQRETEKEVLRYRDAITWGYERLNRLPISTRLILGMHRRLISGRREGFRRTQNRIANNVTGEVLYTPPPAQDLSAHLSNWEKFVNGGEPVDPLIRCTIAHYQFEAIHPFADGNGRVGRILMVLQLVQDGFLSFPILYLSGYINEHRADYYRLLLAVTRDASWAEYILFMLEGIRRQAKRTKDTLAEVMELLEKTRERIKMHHKKIYSGDLVESLFASPIITPAALSRRLDIHYTTASRYLKELAKGKVLEDSIVGKYHLYLNQPLLRILKS
jgi:Fic family protein